MNLFMLGVVRVFVNVCGLRVVKHRELRQKDSCMNILLLEFTTLHHSEPKNINKHPKHPKHEKIETMKRALAAEYRLAPLTCLPKLPEFGPTVTLGEGSARR